jgi:hypothetical protein
MVGPVGACCLLLFASTLQGWGPTSIVGDVFFTLRGPSPAPTIRPVLLSFIIAE